MNYFILSQEIENDEVDAILTGFSEYLDRIRVPFDEGDALPIDDILMPIEILIEENSLRGKVTDLLFIDEVDVHLISGTTRDFFNKKNIINIESLPVKLIDYYSNADEVEEAKLKGEHLEYKEIIYDNYSILNIVGLIDCIDHEASDLEYYTPRLEIPDDMPEDMKKILLEEQEEDNDIDFIRKLVLDEDKIPEDIKIFRLKDCPRILVFKEAIVQAIRKAELSGFVFVPLDQYTDEIPDDDEDETADESSMEDRTDKEPQVEEKPELPQQEEPEGLPKVGGGIVIKGIRRND